MVGCMFERFTTESRQTLQAATTAAIDRGDTVVHPDHLLLGLALPSSGLASQLLAEAGIDEAVVAASMPQAPGGPGPDNPPFTAGTKKALELALREALNLGHGHIGSGHLLLALLRLEPHERPPLLATSTLTLDGARGVVRTLSEGPRLGGRRRPRRTGRIVEAMTPHEQARAAAAQAAATATPAADDEVAVRVATEEGSRLQRALASLGVSPQELQDALAEVAEPVDEGPVEIDLGGGATLSVAAGTRAADLRSLIAAADHVKQSEGADGVLRAEASALGDAVWATLEGWLTA
jgi:ATP-dependent Clp protease ATP-binding subunit ClpA